MPVSFEGIENRYAVPDIIAMEALYRLKHHLVLPMISNRTYEQYFEKKVGDTITIKRPYQAKAQKGRKLKKAEMIDKTLTLSLDQRYHFGLEVVDEDVTLHIEDYGARYLDTGAEELAYQYDIAGANELGQTFFLHNGTAGAELTLAMAQDIRAHATKMAIPRNSQNFALLDPLDISKISQDIQDVDMPQMVGENIRNSYRGMVGGWRVLESVHVPYLKVKGIPTTAAPKVNGASERGEEISTDDWGVNNTTVLYKGQLIQIAGVNEVQPRGDRKATGNKMTFVVTEDATTNGSGEVDVKIYPAINAGTTSDTVANPSGVEFDGTTAKANLDASAFQTVDAIPADNAVITIIGRKTTDADDHSYRQGLYFCGDALEYVNVTLAKPKSATYAGVETDTETGVSISYVADFDIEEMTEQERLDIFFGVKNVYPEIGIRHIGPEVSA